ncbi:hypothetical protein KJZ99_04090 [bacterium]|nr:hypothetical protein [bacterium]
MSVTQKELTESNSKLAEERALLSQRLASIEAVIHGATSDTEKVSLIKAAFIEWAKSGK